MILKKNNANEGGKKVWLKRLGFYGFLFFLIKGLVWVGVGILAWYKLKN